ncbi:hypothetical protein NYE48_27820 [Paenibacillus sp. FSL M7-1455]|uniref:hypothetical protein n=1 Tax=Paenibacillus sp. FSL M7-1455 TaxID=2975316 RepID=UPI0030FC6006
MKATINGVAVEGTPQEIAELMRLVMASDVPMKNPAELDERRASECIRRAISDVAWL